MGIAFGSGLVSGSLSVSSVLARSTQQTVQLSVGSIVAIVLGVIVAAESLTLWIMVKRGNRTGRSGANMGRSFY